MKKSVHADSCILWVVHTGNHDRIAVRPRDEGFACVGWKDV
jgi:hypothetical protein